MARPVLFRLLLAAALAIWAGQPSLSQEAERRPMPVEGKETIFQRVLTRPGAGDFAEADGAARGRHAAFQPFYVFAREGDWIEVGPSFSRVPTGWLRAEEAVDWRQNIVAAFTNPASRERTLFFEGREDLEAVLNHESSVAVAAALRESVAAGTLDPASGVQAVEPEEHIDIREQFYLLPILGFVEQFHPMTMDPFLLLNVASLPLAEDGAAAAAEEALENFDAGVIFVIDTTMSMDPYITATREAVEDIVARIRAEDVGDRIHFGLWGFRDNPGAVPGLEYRTRKYLPLERHEDPGAIVEALASMRATTANSPGFPEDSLAGVEDAIEETEWQPGGRSFGGKYIVLITDASPKAPGDANARSEIDATTLQLRAQERGIAVMTLHLKTGVGAANHPVAEAEYRKLSRFGDNTYYYPIEGGSREAFGAQVRAFVEAFTTHVRVAMGEASDESADGALEELGHAMRLAYLGQQAGTQAPPVFESWVADVALEDGRKIALEPRLLVTRNELSTLDTLIGAVLEAAEYAETGQGDQREFFRQIRDAMIQMAQNPDVLVNTEFSTLGEAFGEMLSDLPYRDTELMRMDEATWLGSGTQQQQVRDRLRARRVLYERWHDDPSNWTALYEGAPDGEHVFAMPMSALP